MKVRKSISIDSKLWDDIDKERGLVPRSAYINKILEEKLSKDDKKNM